MTGLRVSLLGVVALAALFTGAVTLYASDTGTKAEARYLAAPYHVQKAMMIHVQ